MKSRLEQLHQAAMQILENTGIAMMDEETLAIWENAGARVDKESQRVRMERGLVMEAVAKAPTSFTWRARNPKLSNFVGENSITLAPHGGMVYVSDLDNGGGGARSKSTKTWYGYRMRAMSSITMAASWWRLTMWMPLSAT